MVPVTVMVRLLPSAEITIRPVTLTLPFFLLAVVRVRSLTYVYERVSEFGSPVRG